MWKALNVSERHKYLYNFRFYKNMLIKIAIHACIYIYVRVHMYKYKNMYKKCLQKWSVMNKKKFMHTHTYIYVNIYVCIYARIYNIWVSNWIIYNLCKCVYLILRQIQIRCGVSAAILLKIAYWCRFSNFDFASDLSLRLGTFPEVLRLCASCDDCDVRWHVLIWIHSLERQDLMGGREKIRDWLSKFSGGILKHFLNVYTCTYTDDMIVLLLLLQYYYYYYRVEKKC